MVQGKQRFRKVLKPRNFDHIWCAKYSRSIWSSPRALGWIIESGWGSLQSFFLLYFPKKLKNKSLMHISRGPRVLNLNPSIRFKNQCKLVVKTEDFPEKERICWHPKYSQNCPWRPYKASWKLPRVSPLELLDAVKLRFHNCHISVKIQKPLS